MSENTTCNFCRLESIRRDAKKQNKKVVIVPSDKMGDMGGSEVYLMSNGAKSKTKKWVCWFMAIPERCEC
jgi:tRNA A37 methylthiotransferase MiaB